MGSTTVGDVERALGDVPLAARSDGLERKRQSKRSAGPRDALLTAP